MDGGAWWAAVHGVAQSWTPRPRELRAFFSCMAWNLPGSSIHGIFQARVLEWGAIAFSDKISKNGHLCFCININVLSGSTVQDGAFQ